MWALIKFQKNHLGHNFLKHVFIQNVYFEMKIIKLYRQADCEYHIFLGR